MQPREQRSVEREKLFITARSIPSMGNLHSEEYSQQAILLECLPKI